MRKPSEYLPAALRGLRNRLMPDCSETLRHGERFATVTRVGSTPKGGDALDETDVNECVRVLASAADFPDLAKGSLVSLSGGWHIVTGAASDPSGAVLSVGLSASMEATRAAYRRPGTAIRLAVDVLAVEGGVIEPDGDAFAPTASRQWLVAVPGETWYEPTEPQIGDELTLDAAVMRVFAVAKRDGVWILTARARR